jgi:large subunit ribosomal protein L7/L12
MAFNISRTLFNFPLKEAKELVEKAPVTLKKGSAVKEAEELKKKLTELGCTITLK